MKIGAIKTQLLGFALRNLDRIERYGLPVVLAGTACVPAIAQAQIVTGGQDPATIINNIASYILGPIGVSIAGLGIVAEALMLIFAVASMRTFVRVICGIVLLFGCTYIVQQLTGGVGAG